MKAEIHRTTCYSSLSWLAWPVGGPVTDSTVEFSFLVKRIPDNSSLTTYTEDSENAGMF
jgi:hypothetical protein